MKLLDRLHASWPRGVAPSVVEHFADAADHVAPAMTLWSGAERMAGWLSRSGVGAGSCVGCALPPGVRWTQTFVACLMRGAVFCPLPPGSPPEGRACAHLDVTGHLTVSPRAGARVDGPGAVAFAAGPTWSVDALDAAVAALGPSGSLRPGARLVSEAPWWEPAGFSSAFWLGLSVGAELHVGVTDDEVHRLGPDVVTSRPGGLARLLDWVPVAPKGLAVIAGPSAAEDEAVARRRGWELVALPLPG